MGQADSSILLHSNTRELHLEGATLHANVQPATFPLDMILGNINGSFQYGYKAFSQSARNIHLDGTVLNAEFKTETGEWKHSSIDLDDKIYASFDGVLCAKEVPVVVAVPEAAEEAVLKQFEEMLDKNPTIKLAALNYPDGTTTFVATKSNPENAFAGFTNHSDDNPNAKLGYYRIGVDMDGADPNAVFKALDASAKAAVFHVTSKKTHPIKQFSADVLSAQASAGMGGVAGGNDGFPIYAGVDAKVNLVDLKASIFDLNIGLGVQTDIGLKDYSFGTHVAGWGYTIGKKTSISAFGSSFRIDFGRLIG